MGKDVSRRDLFKRGVLGAAGLASVGTVVNAAERLVDKAHQPNTSGTVGTVSRGSFDATAFLESFDYGTVSKLPSGQVVREFEMTAIDKEIEVAPGVFYPAWTYNGQVPGPTLRVTEGDLVRVRFRNLGTHPHSIHFHGIHPGSSQGQFCGCGHFFSVRLWRRWTGGSPG